LSVSDIQSVYAVDADSKPGVSGGMANINMIFVVKTQTKLIHCA